jgi:hypothetical protein
LLVKRPEIIQRYFLKIQFSHGWYRATLIRINASIIYFSPFANSERTQSPNCSLMFSLCSFVSQPGFVANLFDPTLRHPTQGYRLLGTVAFDWGLCEYTSTAFQLTTC